MFRIKICGVTNPEDALAAVDAGADAIGLNFYEKSKRYVTLPLARKISDAATGGTLPIGVFVNATNDRVEQLLQESNLAGLQFHGDEPPSTIAYWAHLLRSPSNDEGIRPLVVRARRFTTEIVREASEDIDACTRLDGVPGAILLDASVPGQFGGTGETLPWAELANRPWMRDIPLILAGGLTPENVAEAIRVVRPQGVDVASGVESSPGRKDHAKVRDFVDARARRLSASD